MWVYEYFKILFFIFLKDCNDIIYIGVIVFFRFCMFEVFLGEDIFKKVVFLSF